MIDSDDKEKLKSMIDEMREELESLYELQDDVESRISTLQSNIDVLERLLNQ